MKRFDVAIIGAGVSGIAAAINAQTEGLKTVIIESSDELGGQARKSTRIENYPGFPDGISGEDLTRRCIGQVKRFNAEVMCPENVVEITTRGNVKVLELESGETIEACSVVIACGLTYRTLHAANLSFFIGHGVYYGCPASEYLEKRKRTIAIVGGANSAGQAAMHLATNNPKAEIHILVRGEGLKESMSHYLIKRINAQENIILHTKTVLKEACGSTELECIKIEENGELKQLEVDAVYIFIGAVPRTRFLDSDLIQKDKHGFILTDRQLKDWPLTRPPYSFETSLPGVFATGDVRADSRKRVLTAMAEGGSAVPAIYDYVHNTQFEEVSFSIN